MGTGRENRAVGSTGVTTLPTVKLTDALAVLPPLSDTLAVTVCAPSFGVAEVEAPVAKAVAEPSKNHWILMLILPSSASVALPAKLTVAPAENGVPVVGAVMETVGALLRAALTFGR